MARRGAMKLGVLSDTHNHVGAAFDAVELLWASGARAFAHCGDMGPDVLAELSRWAVARRTTIYWAYGNCDFGYSDASRYAVSPANVMGDWSVEPAPRVAAIHGHEPHALARLVASRRYDVVCVGHTHCPGAVRSGAAWLLNPGSAARPRSDAGATVLLLDADLMEWHWIALETQKELRP